MSTLSNLPQPQDIAKLWDAHQLNTIWNSANPKSTYKYFWKSVENLLSSLDLDLPNLLKHYEDPDFDLPALPEIPAFPSTTAGQAERAEFFRTYSIIKATLSTQRQLVQLLWSILPLADRLVIQEEDQGVVHQTLRRAKELLDPIYDHMTTKELAQMEAQLFAPDQLRTGTVAQLIARHRKINSDLVLNGHYVTEAHRFTALARILRQHPLTKNLMTQFDIIYLLPDECTFDLLATFILQRHGHSSGLSSDESSAFVAASSDTGDDVRDHTTADSAFESANAVTRRTSTAKSSSPHLLSSDGAAVITTMASLADALKAMGLQLTPLSSTSSKTAPKPTGHADMRYCWSCGYQWSHKSSQCTRKRPGHRNNFSYPNLSDGPDGSSRRVTPKSRPAGYVKDST
jgi:hypothetical protein